MSEKEKTKTHISKISHEIGNIKGDMECNECNPRYTW